MITSKSTVFFSHQEVFPLTPPKKKVGDHWTSQFPFMEMCPTRLTSPGALNSTDVEDPHELSDVSFLSRDR